MFRGIKCDFHPTYCVPKQKIRKYLYKKRILHAFRARNVFFGERMSALLDIPRKNYVFELVCFEIFLTSLNVPEYFSEKLF